MPDRMFARDVVWTAATLSVAHARQSGRELSPTDEARRLLSQYPDAGISAGDLAVAIERLISETPR